MNASTAALIASWIAIGVLFLAYAGLRRQLLLIERAPRVEPIPDSKVRRQVALGARKDEPAIVMLAADDCPVCHDVAPVFQDLASDDRSKASYVLLKRSGVSDDSASPARTVVDPQAFNTIYPGYLPALILLDSQGFTMAVEPVGAKEALISAHRGFTNKLRISANSGSTTGASTT